MKKISIVIPVYNEEFFISGTLESVLKIEYPREDFEVLVVTDGCTDGTVSAVKKFPFVRILELKQNVGRYAARKAGAEAAIHPNILFIDSRTRADPQILSVINQVNALVIQGVNFSVENPGLFEIFYKSVRRKVFSQYYSKSSEIIELTKDNFDFHPKGTNVFFIQKDVLFQAYKDLDGIDMSGDSSDDTKLINKIVQQTPAIIHPDVKVLYYYRSTFLANARHLYGFNATSFVDYYFHPSQRYFWIVIVIPLMVLLVLLAGLIFIPIQLWIKITTLVVLDIFISLYLAQSLKEFTIILFMMPLSVLIFYLGIIRGIFIKFKKEMRSKQ
ncbi:MAG: glycosyltransferase family 2 protein [Anaerolineales bacterium]|nr:glycosyltransferase family 2 protein [Anaerolineales bacterium]MBP6208646.1 glycosyltransferase family 2 protein [Anaerolineales bacterium]